MKGTGNMKKWRDVFKIHPSCACFPEISGDDLNSLVADIKKNGLLHAPITYKSKDNQLWLLDGRSRMDAMERLGWNIVEEQHEHKLHSGLGIDARSIGSSAVSLENLEQTRGSLQGRDPLFVTISCNIRRRHLTPGQRSDLLVEALKSGKTWWESNSIQSDTNQIPTINRVVTSLGSNDPKLEGRPKGIQAAAIAIGKEAGVSEATMKRALTKQRTKENPELATQKKEKKQMSIAVHYKDQLAMIGRQYIKLGPRPQAIVKKSVADLHKQINQEKEKVS